MDTDDLKLALERQRGENKELVEALLQLEADYAQLEQERTEVQEEVGRLRRATVAAEETDGAWEELDATKSSLLYVQQELKLLKRQRESLEEEKQEMRDTIQELTTENLTLTKGNFRGHQQLLEVQQAVKQLKADLQRVKEERDAQGKELAKVNRPRCTFLAHISPPAQERPLCPGKAPLLRADGDDSGATGDPGGPSEQNKPTERRAGGFGAAECAPEARTGRGALRVVAVRDSGSQAGESTGGEETRHHLLAVDAGLPLHLAAAPRRLPRGHGRPLHILLRRGVHLPHAAAGAFGAQL
ncbi:transmembrane protein 191B isoform X1 [Mauremys reevesii]|uniref:transmembrane protein 191B isoform X1 n=1 Tax=Mauremys reevesii TaxID=260615 RepID=UPI00193FD578|nr:transmembrane protein 191B isoform X1 [Mauremys reevesii]XP_039366378.1 transmembrane protein 191B isoform X1 [Mauremys reevesii]